MNKRGANFWDIIAWIVLIAILVWIILKVSGVINSPSLVEYAPLFGAVYLAGWAMHKLDRAVDDIKDIKNFNYQTVKEINTIKKKCIKNHSKPRKS